LSFMEEYFLEEEGMIRFILVLLMFIETAVHANIGPKGFKAYSGEVFVETGTYLGKGVRLALEAGFEEIHSLDIDPIMVENCQKKFANYKNVSIHHKDSSTQLWDVISEIDKPITFWLDAHNGFPDPNAHEVKNTCILDELEQIKNHPIKTHTILIDDLHCCGTIYFDYIKVGELVQKLFEINPNYSIEFIEGGDDGEYPNNILVATDQYQNTFTQPNDYFVWETNSKGEEFLNGGSIEQNVGEYVDFIPEVSVIIPCKYSHIHLLSEALDALKFQTKIPDEVIVSISEIARCSPIEIEKLKKSDYPYKLKLICNRGVKYAGQNRNIAVQNSSGNIIITQDADDLPHPQRVEIISYFLKKTQACQLFHRWCPIDPATITSGLIPPKWIPFYEDFDQILSVKIKNVKDLEGLTFLHHGNIGLFRFVSKVTKWINGPKNEDVIFNNKIISQFRDTVYITAPLVIYRRGLSSWLN